METGEVIYEKIYASPRLPPKISLKHDWMKELGSEVAQRQEGQVVQQFKFPIQTQIMMIERRHPLSAVTQVKSQEPPKHVPSRDSTNFNVGDETNHDRTEKPVALADH